MLILKKIYRGSVTPSPFQRRRERRYDPQSNQVKPNVEITLQTGLILIVILMLILKKIYCGSVTLSLFQRRRERRYDSTVKPSQTRSNQMLRSPCKQNSSSSSFSCSSLKKYTVAPLRYPAFRRRREKRYDPTVKPGQTQSNHTLKSPRKHDPSSSSSSCSSSKKHIVAPFHGQTKSNQKPVWTTYARHSA